MASEMRRLAPTLTVAQAFARVFEANSGACCPRASATHGFLDER